MSKKKECSNLETRTMNVTMSQDDFKKLDSGELRSNHGLRDSSGHIKASLDISYISENELPQREVVRTETVYKESPVPSPTAQALTGTTMEILGDILSDPEVKKSISDLIHVLWHYKVQPKIQDTIDRIKGISQPQPPRSEQVFQTKAEQILSSQTMLFRRLGSFCGRFSTESPMRNFRLPEKSMKSSSMNTTAPLPLPSVSLHRATVSMWMVAN